jgi:hypothetical protein
MPTPKKFINLTRKSGPKKLEGYTIMQYTTNLTRVEGLSKRTRLAATAEASKDHRRDDLIFV